ncbi:MAG: 23S rRNA (pseudouridine(1915)-N(3))-methyltransferase RlmH, partial [Luteimonas sp.]
MKARLIAVGDRAPAWVAQGFADYQQRLSHVLPLELIEIPPGLRGPSRNAARAVLDEGARVLAALPKQAQVVALDGGGRAGSPPLSRTLTRRPIEALRSVHVEAKEVQ